MVGAADGSVEVVPADGKMPLRSAGCAASLSEPDGVFFPSAARCSAKVGQFGIPVEFGDCCAGVCDVGAGAVVCAIAGEPNAKTRTQGSAIIRRMLLTSCRSVSVRQKKNASALPKFRQQGYSPALDVGDRQRKHINPGHCRNPTSAAGDEIDHPDRGQIGNATTDVAALEEKLAAMVTVVERHSPRLRSVVGAASITRWEPWLPQISSLHSY
jgi:hypothetical protein